MNAKKQKESNGINSYLFRDNIKRFFLKDRLGRIPYLKNLTIEQLDELVRTCNVLISNLNNAFDKGTIKIGISDENNWPDNSLFRDIILQNVLDYKPTFVHEIDLKKELKKRWDSEEVK